MKDRSNTIHIHSSKEGRVIETTELVSKSLSQELYSDASIKIDDRLYPAYHKNLEEILSDFKHSWMSEADYVTDFLHCNRKLKPLDIAMPYLNKLNQIFTIYNTKYKGKTVVLKSFRHWEKSENGTLTEKGKLQATQLGIRIWNELKYEKNDFVHLLGTHNMLNESIITTLFWKENFSQEELTPLWFTEKVDYVLYEKDGISELELTFRNKKRKISFSEFQKRIKNLQNEQNKKNNKV